MSRCADDLFALLLDVTIAMENAHFYTTSISKIKKSKYRQAKRDSAI